MPEEKKKDSFTFSDKIKSGTKTSSKSFANRISSKIGSDGKPRQTLFERTKRDAPFFIAALVALLLLPFLYKYSGQVAEEPTMITPGYEDAMVNPDRSGFDFTGDPEGQIAQLAGRDSMDLIVGFGKKGGEEEKDESLGDIYRSGLADSSASSYSRRNATEEEVNNTNIYKYRKDAAPQTRAAFRRAATKINSLRGAALSGRGGGRGITPWGGNMKSAASKVRAPGMRNSAKPVSLQPLVAAGKPSRSYFGQANADLARKSKDAMSKASAMQALMDAQFKPVEPSRIGGLGAGDFGGPGGGPGGLARNFTYNGKEPWWWDLMKLRAQKEWEAKFNYRWGWINWATGLVQNWLAGILNCAVTGDSGGDVDNFFGSGGGSGKTKETCCGVEAKDVDKDLLEKAGSLKGICDNKSYKNELLENLKMKECVGGYKGGSASGVRLNGLQQRWKCLGGKVKGAGVGLAAEVSDCGNMVNEHYRVNPEGKARKWNKYVYVVARNYLPDNMKLPGSPVGYLCSPDSDRTRVNANYAAGGGAVNYSGLGDANEKRSEKYSHVKEYKEQHMSPSVHELDRESEEDSCVIYLTNSDTLEPKSFHSAVLNMLIKRLGGDKEKAVKAYQSLEFMFVEAFIAKDKLGYRSDLVDLPMTYDRFYNAYIRHKRTEAAAGAYTADVYENEQYFTEHDKQAKRQSKADRQAKRSEKDAQRNEGKGKDKKRLDVDKRPYRTENEDYVMGQKCYFDKHVRIMCGAEGEAVVSLQRAFKGQLDPKAVKTQKTANGEEKVANAPAEIRVAASFTALDEGGMKSKEQTISNPRKGDEDNQLVYSYQLSGAKEGTYGTLLWTVYRGGKVAGTAECDYKTGKRTTLDDREPCEKGHKIPLNGDGSADGKCQYFKKCVEGEAGKFFYDEENLEPNMDDPDCQEQVKIVEKIIKEKEIIYVDKPCKDVTPIRMPVPGKTDCEVEYGCHDNVLSLAFIGSGCDEEKVVPVMSYRLHSDVKMIPSNPFNLTTRPDTLTNTKSKDGDEQWGSCQMDGWDELLLHLPDRDTMDYVNKARDVFKKKTGYDLVIDETGESFTASNLIDVINMNPDSKGVPGNVVCILGKTISNASPDEQAHPSGAFPASGAKFDNTFGAFLAYIDYDAASFPMMTTTAEINKEPVTVNDERFKCRAGDGIVWPAGSDFHYCWGGYTVCRDRKKYEEQINKAGSQWSGLPLKGLMRRDPNKPSALVSVAGKTQQSDGKNRDDYGDIYEDLISTRLSCRYDGVYLKQEDVKKYIGSLCANGSRKKPRATIDYARNCGGSSGSSNIQEQGSRNKSNDSHQTNYDNYNH